MVVDFELDSEFSDERNLKSSWDQIQLPFQTLLFFSILLNFNVADFYVPRPGDVFSEFDSSKSLFLKVVSLYQIIYYIMKKGTKKTPLHILNGIAVHDTCRGKSLINSLNRIGVSVGYVEVMRIRNDLAEYVLECGEQHVPLPSHFRTDMFTVAAFDNFDHNESTLSGLNSTHDTVSVLFQDKCGGAEVEIKKPKIGETKVQHRQRSFKKLLNCQTIQNFVEPPKHITLPENYIVTDNLFSLDSKSKEAVARKEFLWEICRMNLTETENEVDRQQIPTWSAFNHLISQESPSQQIVGFLPIIPKPVTKYSTVYTALLNFQNVLKQLQQDKLAIPCDEGIVLLNIYSFYVQLNSKI